MKKKRMNVLAIAITALGISPVWAQTSGDADMMDQMPQQGVMPSTADEPKATQNAMPTMDHGSMMPGMSAPSPTAAMPMATDGAMPAMDPSTMDHGSMDHGAMPGMQPNTSGTADGMAGMEHGSQTDMTGMNAGMGQGEMNMQGGPAPTDARDPHAYSDGYTLDSGAYVLPPSQRLHMADERNFGALLFDRLERSYTRDGNSTSYDAQAWFGRDYNRLVIKAEGDVAQGKLQEARTELLWGHAIATFWDTQLGVRHDSGTGPDRSWLAFGVQGLAPYWFGVDAAAYVGDQGRSALRLSADYELLITQKLVLQPRIEVNLYGKSDVGRGVGSGLSETQTGVRLRYEFTRQFAPYVGVERVRKFGQTADLARAGGEKAGVTQWVAGVRFWF